MQKSLFSVEYDLFCRLLKQVREETGLSQNQLAKRLNTPQAWLSKVENGHRRVDVIELWRICTGIGIEPAKFMERLTEELRKQQTNNI